MILYYIVIWYILLYFIIGPTPVALQRRSDSCTANLRTITKILDFNRFDSSRIQNLNFEGMELIQNLDV